MTDGFENIIKLFLVTKQKCPMLKTIRDGNLIAVSVDLSFSNAIILIFKRMCARPNCGAMQIDFWWNVSVILYIDFHQRDDVQNVCVCGNKCGYSG